MPRIEIIKVKELKGFVESEQFKNLLTLPISTHRALSQYNNPRADANDPALIVAFNEQDVLGYFGLLPDEIGSEKVFWNSCWWSHPVKGKKISMHLFYMGLALCQQKMLLTDFTEHTRPLIEKTGFFEFGTTRHGIRGFLRFYYGELLPARKKALKPFSFFFELLDFSLNLLMDVKAAFIKKQLSANKPQFIKTTYVDEEAHDFIIKNFENNLIKRSSKELNWIIKHPWVLPDQADEMNEKSRYFFSAFDRTFEYDCFKLYSHEKEMVAFLMFKNRNDHYSLPYFYCKPSFEYITIEFLISHLLKKKAKSFVCFHPVVVESMKEKSFPCIYKKDLQIHFAYSKPLGQLAVKESQLQDGDGDVVFT